MANLISFINSFLSYLLLFGAIVVLVVIACIIGVRWRKAKDAKEAMEQENAITQNGEPNKQ